MAVLSGSFAHGWSWTSKTSLTALYNPGAWLRRQTAIAIIWDYLLCSEKIKKTIREKNPFSHTNYARKVLLCGTADATTNARSPLAFFLLLQV